MYFLKRINIRRVLKIDLVRISVVLMEPSSLCGETADFYDKEQ